jgi:hypothetical protein
MTENTETGIWPSPIKIIEGCKNNRYHYVGLQQGPSFAEEEIKKALKDAYLLELEKEES